MVRSPCQRVGTPSASVKAKVGDMTESHEVAAARRPSGVAEPEVVHIELAVPNLQSA